MILILRKCINHIHSSISIISLSFNWYNKYFHKLDDQRETGVKAFIGNSYKVTETINNVENIGRVKIGSESWRAKSDSDIQIERGELITVSKVDGSTLIVSSTENKGE